MAISWTIAGQTGKTLGPTQVSLESLRVSNAKVTYRNLATDTFTFSLGLSSLAGSGDTIPALGQTITLFRAAARYFHGVVTGARQVGWRIDVTVSGPWWWFERIALESTFVDATGAAGDRAAFAMPAQDLTNSLYALTTKLTGLGVPFQHGTFASTFPAPALKLNQGSFAQAISEIARVTPDLVLYFDYRSTPPALYTVRRLAGIAQGTAEPLTLDASLVADFELNPLTELEVAGVRVPYIVRSPSGEKKFRGQYAGADVVGKVLLHTVSGDEMDTFLPNDLLDFVDVQTINTPAVPEIDQVMYFDPFISKVVQRFGTSSLGLTTPFITMWESPAAAGGSSVKVAQPDDSPRYKLSSGAGLSPANSGLLISEDLPEWALRQLGAQRVIAKGTIYGYWPVAYGSSPVFPENQRAMRAGAITGKNWSTKITPSNPLAATTYWYRRPWIFEAILLPKRYNTLTRIYRASDYAFRVPPNGFAEGLLAAQNYIPYEGRCKLVEDDAGAARFMNRALNFSNSQPVHASIRAMVTEESVDIGTGQTLLYMGPPARFSYLELVNKMRTSGNDQITYV